MDIKYKSTVFTDTRLLNTKLMRVSIFMHEKNFNVYESIEVLNAAFCCLSNGVEKKKIKTCFT